MSSKKNRSILDIKSLAKNEIERVFAIADRIFQSGTEDLGLNTFGKTGGLLFFEASTRTRFSFQTACARFGIHPLFLDGKSGSSLEKGETLSDSVLNMDAMGPSFLVIRCGDELDLNELSQQVTAPIINAGWGTHGHPTQALLDAYTIQKNLGNCQGQRVLIVGDVRHSRVAASHIELAQKLNYEIAFCGPEEFLQEVGNQREFTSLREGFEWATVAMALRVQHERHSHKYSLADYRENFGFNKKNLEALSPQSLIMHPGPINRDVEMDSNVLTDPRCKVLSQVSNGVLIRQSLLYITLSEGEL